LQYYALREGWFHQLVAKHLAHLIDSELVLDGLWSDPVDHHSERSETRRDSALQLAHGPERSLRRSHGEQTGLRDDEDPVARCPRHAGQAVERRWTVNQHQVVVSFDLGEDLFHPPNLAFSEHRGVELHRGRGAQHEVDRAAVVSGPTRGQNRLPNRLALGVTEDMGHGQVVAHHHIETGRSV